MSADTINLGPELDFNHYIDLTDNICITYADLDNLKPPILNLNECDNYDEKSFLDKFANNKNPLFLSLNIQSLQKFFFELSTFATLDIPGFQRLIFKSRSLNREGRVGFYVRSGISPKIIIVFLILITLSKFRIL